MTKRDLCWLLLVAGGTFGSPWAFRLVELVFLMLILDMLYAIAGRMR